MKKLIFKKFAKDVFQFFLLVSLSISLIVWVIQAVNFLDIITEDGHGFKVYFLYTLFNFPKIFSKFLMNLSLLLEVNSLLKMHLLWNFEILLKHVLNFPQTLKFYR